MLDDELHCSPVLVSQVWRNALPIIERLLEAKASPDIQDAESGW